MDAFPSTDLELRIRYPLDATERSTRWLRQHVENLSVFLGTVPGTVSVEVQVEDESDAALFMLNAKRRVAFWSMLGPRSIRAVGGLDTMRVEHLWAEHLMRREGIQGRIMVTVDLEPESDPPTPLVMAE